MAEEFTSGYCQVIPGSERSIVSNDTNPATPPPSHVDTVDGLLDEAATEIAKERELMALERAAIIKKEDGYRYIINELVAATLLTNREDRRNHPFCNCGASIEKQTRTTHRESCIRLRNMLEMLHGHFVWVNR